ncbi:protein Frey 1 [Erethizon dorsatum]
MVPAMLGALYPRAGLSLFLLYLILAARLLRPQPLRPVLEELPASLELSQPLSDLVDDYGIRPRHPRLRQPGRRGPRPLLSRAQQRKRDGPDMAEYYYDNDDDNRGD